MLSRHGAEHERPAEIEKRTQGRYFLTGASINLLNPKAYLFFFAVAPGFLDGEILTLGNAVLLALVSATIATAIHLAIIITGARAQGWLSDPRRKLLARRGFALIMLAAAASFVISALASR